MNSNKEEHNKTNEMEDKIKEYEALERKISFVADVALVSNRTATVCALIAILFQLCFMMWVSLAILVVDCIFEELYLRFAK